MLNQRASAFIFLLNILIYYSPSHNKKKNSFCKFYILAGKMKMSNSIRNYYNNV